MVPMLPFLLLAGLLLPVLAWRSRSRLHALDERDTRAARALAAQALLVHLVLGVTALLASGSAGLEIALAGRITPWVGLQAALVLGLSLGAARAYLRRGVAEPGNPLRRILQRVPVTDPVWLAVLVSAAVVEEFAYRGVLTGLLEAWAVPLAPLVSALLFGLAHLAQGWWGFALSTAFALLLQSLAVNSGGLLLPMAVHFGYDLGARILARRAVPPGP